MNIAMPIYEYACDHCRKIYSFLVRNPSRHKLPKCPKCGRKRMKRIISSFLIGHTEDSRIEKLSDPSLYTGIDENDPKSLARFMRKMGKEMGEDMPEEFEEMCHRLEAGENPEEIEKSLGEAPYTKDESGKLYEA